MRGERHFQLINRHAMPVLIGWLTTTAVLFLVQPAFAETVTESMFSLYFENDSLLNTDRSYTNGVRLHWSSHMGANDKHWWLPNSLLSKWFPRDLRSNTDGSFEWWSGWTFGQSMYTPDVITEPNLIENDRPYGGWLYMGPTFSAMRKKQNGYRTVQHSFDLLVGVVGDPSFAEGTQTFVHKFIVAGAPEPQGWSHQIATEPTLNLIYAGRRREYEALRSNYRVFDAISEWSFAAGNAFTYAGLGTTARLGRSMGEGFGPSRIEPALSSEKHNWEAYIFGRVNIRYVLHNIFLDGGWFAESEHTVDREHIVSDIEAGVTFRYERCMISVRVVGRSPEFHERQIVQKYVAFNWTLIL